MTKSILWSAGEGLRVTTPVYSQMATVIESDGAWSAHPKRPVLVYPGRITPETESEFLLRVAEGGAATGALAPEEGAVPKGVAWSVCNATAVPADKTFRQAWTQDAAGGVSVDMAKARAIHMDRIRSARNMALDRLDKLYTRARGQNKQAEAEAVESQRQMLRDIPQTLDLSMAGTPEALKALWPAGWPPNIQG
ncbi:MAG: hypothetical protein HY057_06195 [Rhodospirillales bacterium]|nr:hypothetical protein [Rhodospirillales bacterium]